MKFIGKRVLVYGMGLGGQSCCALLHKLGACVSFFDDEKRFSNLFNFDKNPDPAQYQLLVVSGNIKISGNELISRFIAAKVQIFSLLDLAYIVAKGKIIAVSGTNGKTTCANLIGNIFKEAKKECFVCSDLGLPMTSVCQKTTKNSTLIVEASKEQLEISSLFKSDIFLITNAHMIERDNVDLQKKILALSKKKNIIINGDDEFLQNAIINKKTRKFTKKTQKNFIFVKNNAIFYKNHRIIPISDIPLLGQANLENVLGGIAVSIAAGIKIKDIKRGICAFSPLAHRLEFIGKVGGAAIFDDSKSANVWASESAIFALNAKILSLIMGGQKENGDFEAFFAKNYNITDLVCFGEGGKRIAIVAQKYGYHPQVFANFVDAVNFVKNNLISGQIVLLSPGCTLSEIGYGQIFKEIMLS